MSVVIKTNAMKYKDSNGNYQGFNAIAQESTDQQITNITNAGQTQVNNIQQKGSETLDSIPDDYTELAGDVSNLKSQSPSIVTPEETEGDLYICDSNGNVLAKFVDGSFVVKNFDSSSVGDLSELSTEAKTTLVDAINEAAESGGISDIIMDTEETEADLYLCDGAGNVLAEFKNGDIITKNFDSSNVGTRPEKDILLNSYEQIPYNLESGDIWSYSTTYKGILIPAKDLSYTNKFYSGTYKICFSFLRSSSIIANTAPDYCLGTSRVTLTAGQSKYYELPSDCAFVYVYVSDGTYFGQMGIVRMSDDFNMHSVISNSEKPAYVASVAQSLLTAKHMNSGVLHDFVGTNVSDSLLTFAHISDLHNDPANYTRFLNLLNEHDDIIDFGVVSGDLVDSGSNANFAEMVGCESVLNGNVPVYKCVGNHETGMTLANIYTAYQPGSGDGLLYFAKDFSTQKIRVIFLNQYDNETSTRGNTGHYSQTQIDWFISQLQGAITNDLSVIVVLHSMGESGWALYNKQGFYQQVLGPMYGAVNSGPIISDIINAFKHSSSLTQTYTYTDGDGSISVSASFNGYGKFVCFIAGHEHVDVIGYSPIYPDQLICLVQGGVVTSTTRTETQAHWQSKYDTPRIANTVTADSINVYSIDTVEKLVKVVKVGSTITDKFETRSFAVFGY